MGSVSLLELKVLDPISESDISTQTIEQRMGNYLRAQKRGYHPQQPRGRQVPWYWGEKAVIEREN